MAKSEDGGQTVTVERLEMGADEADRKIRGEGWNPLYVENMDPAFNYRWLNKNKMNISRKTSFLGYEIVQGGGKERSVLDGDTPLMKKAENVAGPIEVGDMVLGRIPKEKHLKYRKAHDELVKRRNMAIGPSVKNAIDQAAGSRVSYEESRDNPSMKG